MPWQDKILGILPGDGRQGEWQPFPSPIKATVSGAFVKSVSSSTHWASIPLNPPCALKRTYRTTFPNPRAAPLLEARHSKR